MTLFTACQQALRKWAHAAWKTGDRQDLWLRDPQANRYVRLEFFPKENRYRISIINTGQKRFDELAWWATPESEGWHKGKQTGVSPTPAGPISLLEHGIAMPPSRAVFAWQPRGTTEVIALVSISYSSNIRSSLPRNHVLVLQKHTLPEPLLREGVLDVARFWRFVATGEMSRVDLKTSKLLHGVKNPKIEFIVWDGKIYANNDEFITDAFLGRSSTRLIRLEP